MQRGPKDRFPEKETSSMRESFFIYFLFFISPSKVKYGCPEVEF